MKKPTSILVVDDSTYMAKTMADILMIKGYLVHSVHSGKDALAVLKAEHIDVLLTDVIMPEMDGVMLNRLAQEAHPGIFSMFMTAYSADDLIQQGIKDGVKTVLSKPVDIDFLLSLLTAAEAYYLHA
jgi:CheY-like chemotaxis protein